mmetsp:Transcript_4887/g.4137  ORF Transcript_4887/g.4137 Transcript_4887/m.4137 type:complete len:85 (+) Transcript_4887:414-668(+)
MSDKWVHIMGNFETNKMFDKFYISNTAYIIIYSFLLLISLFMLAVFSYIAAKIQIRNKPLNCFEKFLVVTFVLPFYLFMNLYSL